MLLLSHRPTTLNPRHGIAFRRHDEPQRPPRRYSVHTSKDDTFSEVEETEGRPTFRPQLSRAVRKALRPTRPAIVLASINGPARDLYVTPSGGTDLSYTAPRRPSRKPKPKAGSCRSTLLLDEPVSLYSILARFLQHHTATPAAKSDFYYAPLEMELLQNQGYTMESVERWASCLVAPRSIEAARVFEQGVEMPPLFLLLLFLRRKHIKAPALDTIMRHLVHVAYSESISWSQLKIITVRLLHHVREHRPESMSWVASFFAAEASRLHDNTPGADPLPPNTLSDLTGFCNKLLKLISLPTPSRPVVTAVHQEKAQFQILQYMANRSPAVAVTRLGFLSVALNQLAHAKTPQEREWAELKGSAWPPWKENRTAMDEDKGYEFGASRASQLLHRMHEAGYSGGLWEDIVQVYAGWDKDSSPTIQTRTVLPLSSFQYRKANGLRALLWAGRIRATRTRREAWACFLSQELSGGRAHSAIYLAMFEKLHYGTAERLTHPEFSSDAGGTPEEGPTYLLPGDMKEVLPDPLSTLHHVYISEPVPGYRELFQRMQTTQLKPDNHLLVFLIETCPDFDMGLELLAMAKDRGNGIIGRILDGTHDQDLPYQPILGYFIKAIIVFLCRYGRVEQSLPKEVHFLRPEQHANQLRSNRNYLVEYAYMVLRHYRPLYRPAWAAMIEKLAWHINQNGEIGITQYKRICDILEQMEQLHLNVDDEIFLQFCVATRYTAQTAQQGFASIEDTRHVLSTSSHRLRTLFNSLVGINADVQSPSSHQTGSNVVPLHIPGPAELHAYVRALTALRDYEGLYSFTTWLTKHHVEVTARAKAQHSGRDILFKILVALRLAIDGGALEPEAAYLSGAPEDIALLIKTQIESVEQWGGWPEREYVDMYINGHLKSEPPLVGGR